MPGLTDTCGQNLTFATHHDFDSTDVVIVDIDSADGFRFGFEHRLHAFFNVQEMFRWLSQRGAQLNAILAGSPREKCGFASEVLPFSLCQRICLGSLGRAFPFAWPDPY